MDRVDKSDLKSLCRSIQLPVFALVLLLSRSPLLRVLVERQFSISPRAAHLVKWISGASALVGGINTVTGATASVQLLKGYDDTSGYVGEYFRLSFASIDYVVGSYRLGGVAPEGLTLNPTVNEFGVGTIDGIPTKNGVFNLDIWAYEDANQTGDSTLLAITVYINEKGPTILDQPQSVSLPWGSELNLELGLQKMVGASFQWKKDGAEIPGATTSFYGILQATSGYEGVYEVAVTQDGITVISESASVSIVASGMQLWKEEAFDDPFDQISDPLNDPDQDGLINLIEYAIGTDPEKPTVVQLPSVGRQKTLVDDYVVYSFIKNPRATDISISAEYTVQLVNATWIPITNFLNGILIEESETVFVIKIPSEAACFIRFRISDH